MILTILTQISFFICVKNVFLLIIFVYIWYLLSIIFVYNNCKKLEVLNVFKVSQNSGKNVTLESYIFKS